MFALAFALSGRAAGADTPVPATYSGLINGEILHANTLEFAGLAFRDVVTVPLFAGRTLSFTDCHATAYGGTVIGRVDVDVDTGLYHCHCEVANIDLGNILREFGGNNSNVGGVVSGWIDITIPAGKSDQMVGRGEVNIERGSLVQLPLLANLLIGDPSSHKGQDSAMARFEFHDSQIQLMVARLNSPAARIAIKGSIGFDGDLRLYLIPKFKFDLIDQFPGLGPIVAPVLSSVTSRVARALVRGQVTKPVMVINPFMKDD